MTDGKVAFIGGGNMTRAIVGGLLEGGFAVSRLCIAEPHDEQRQILRHDLPGLTVSADNEALVSGAEVVVFAVKPQVLPQVCRQLAARVATPRPLFASIAAGVRSIDIDRWLGGGNAIVRIMPNQPALLRLGVSALYANEATSKQQLLAAKEIMSAVGATVTVPTESDIDAVTAISGSGPAYFYLLIDILTKTGLAFGLDNATAALLALETARGAAFLAADSEESTDDLIARVRSPGGTTAAALDSLQAQGVRDIFNNAVTAARDRAVELADQAHESSQD